MPLPAGDCLQTMGRSTICLLIVFPLVAAIIEGRPTVRRNAGGESPNPITFLPDAKFPAVSSKNRDTRNTAVLGSALSDGNANRATTFIPNEEFSLEFGNVTSCGDGMCRCNATYADCSKHGANLTYVPQLPPGVTFLNFSYNRALISHDDFFMNVTDIEHLELGSNRLKFISHGAFLPLKKLQRLNLGLNPLTYETLAPALSVKTLIKLVLIGLGLGPLPDDLFHKYPLSHLEELLLYGNSISRVNMSVFAPLNNLKQLLLGSNKIHQIHSAYLPQRFDVLLGHGWDNLRNEEQGGPVVVLSFSKCLTTDDGRFLLPDTVSVVPVMSSNIETSSELISDMASWTSATSFSINAGASGILDDIGMISGKFSTEYQYMASKQVQEKSFTTRAQVRYVRYKMQLQPDTPLHPTFRGRLLDIAAAHTLQEDEQADYMAQLLVRDFGTHVITGVQAGAALLKIDHLSRSFLTEYEGEDFDFRASAGASLFGLLSASMSLGFHFKQDSTQKYDDARTSTQVRSLGGPIYQPNNFTMDTWAKHVDENLVALDRSGAPLHTFVTTPALPELPPSIVRKVSASVQKAVVTYYTFNRIPGCLDVNSPSFSLAANYDDGSCKPPATNETFGGVYQTCEMTDSENGDLCGSLVQTNPLTGDTSCPPSYRAVPLHQGTARNSRTEHQCHSFLSWKWHCHDVVYQSTASYSIYWCVADQPVPQDSGYLFGGLYTTQVANPVTQRQSCPPSYLALAVGSGLRVCVSDDFVAGADSSVPFGGFFSCTSGNPLAAGVNKACADGYSQHLAIVDQGCEINYCTQTPKLHPPKLPSVKRPPFTLEPAAFAPPKDNMVIFDRVSRTWHRDEKAVEYMAMIGLEPSVEGFAAYNMSVAEYFVNASRIGSCYQVAEESKLSPASDEASGMKKATQTAQASQMTSSEELPTPMSAGSAAAIAVVATLACVLLLAVGVLTVRAYQRRRRAQYRPLKEPQCIPHADYGAQSESAKMNGAEEYH